MGLGVWLRAGAGLAACAVAAAALDLWLRFWVLLHHRANERERIRAFNRAVRIWGRTLFGVARWATGLQVSIQGRVPTEGRFLVVANHSSSLEIPLLVTVLGSLNLKFVAMERLRNWRPFISLVLRHGGFVIVRKERLGEDLSRLQRFGSELARLDGSPVIFPAGRLARADAAPAFHLGGLEALRRSSRLPLLPVAIAGLERAPSIAQIPRLAGARVVVRILEPASWQAADRNPRSAYRQLESAIYRAVTGRQDQATAVRPGARGTSAGTRDA